MAEQFITVKITGLSEIQKKLEALPEKVAKKGIRSALLMAAEHIRKVIVAYAPKDTGWLSEHFNIKIRAFHGFLASIAHVGPDAHASYPMSHGFGSRGGKRRTPPAVIAVAGFQEFGWIRNGKRIQAKPFMRPAFTAAREKATEIIIDELRRALEESAR
jgi:HK97 gp10 family phage protein